MTTARLLTYEGSTDGIRFGLLGFEGSRTIRRFLIDRLSGAVRLWRLEQCSMTIGKPDEDPEHIAAAKALLTRLEPLPAGADCGRI